MVTFAAPILFLLAVYIDLRFFYDPVSRDDRIWSEGASEFNWDAALDLPREAPPLSHLSDISFAQTGVDAALVVPDPEAQVICTLPGSALDLPEGMEIEQEQFFQDGRRIVPEYSAVFVYFNGDRELLGHTFLSQYLGPVSAQSTGLRCLDMDDAKFTILYRNYGTGMDTEERTVYLEEHPDVIERENRILESLQRRVDCKIGQLHWEVGPQETPRPECPD